MALRPPNHAFDRSSRRVRLGLLWLALLVALAQAIAIGHSYTHDASDSPARSSGQHPGGLAHCLSCVAAAAVGGAAPPTSALPLLALAPPSPRTSTPVPVRFAPQQRPYAIRAPPVLAG